MTISGVDVVPRDHSVIVAMAAKNGCELSFVFAPQAFVLCGPAKDQSFDPAFSDIKNVLISEDFWRARGGVRFGAGVNCCAVLSIASCQIVDSRYRLNRKFNRFAHICRRCCSVILECYVRDWLLSYLKVGQLYAVHTKIGPQLRIRILLLKFDGVLRALKGAYADSQTNDQPGCAKACDPDLSPRRLEKLFCRVGHRLLGGQVQNFALDGSRLLSLFSQGYAERRWINGGAFRLPAARSDGAAQNSYKKAGQSNYKATVLHAAALAQISRFVQ